MCSCTFSTFFKTSAAIGMVELTGLVMMPMNALGHTLAQAVTKSLTMLAFVLNKSSLVMPGLRGRPAGIITTYIEQILV